MKTELNKIGRTPLRFSAQRWLPIRNPNSRSTIPVGGARNRSPLYEAILQIVAIAATVIGVCFGAGCATKDTSIPGVDFLALSYQQFDQTPGSGWRVLSDRGEYREAALLIEAYLMRNSGFPEDQRVILHFHAAQAFAFAHDTSAALAHLEQAKLDSEPPGSPVRWNDYVLATRAFLQRDRTQLVAARERIASSSPVDGEIPNLKIVDSLVAHFGAPYATAYRAQR